MNQMEPMRSAWATAPHIVDQECRMCSRCLARQACRTRAIGQQDPDEPPFIDASRCYGCRACVPACPFGAVAP